MSCATGVRGEGDLGEGGCARSCMCRCVRGVGNVWRVWLESLVH